MEGGWLLQNETAIAKNTEQLSIKQADSLQMRLAAFRNKHLCELVVRQDFNKKLWSILALRKVLKKKVQHFSFQIPGRSENWCLINFVLEGNTSAERTLGCTVHFLDLLMAECEAHHLFTLASSPCSHHVYNKRDSNLPLFTPQILTFFNGSSQDDSLTLTMI